MSNSDPKLSLATRFCRCRGCGEYFGSVRGFDLHRRGKVGVNGDRRCVAPGDLLDGKGEPRLRLNEKGYWVGVMKDGRFQ